MPFEIHIFHGDPNRDKEGGTHTGFMFSLRMEDGSYHKSERAWSTEESAALSAAIEAKKIRQEAGK